MMRKANALGSLSLSVTLLLASGALADLTPQTIPFGQDWTNTGLITADNDWSGVPGIIGHRGDEMKLVRVHRHRVFSAMPSCADVRTVAVRALATT